jgi:hypothetical protein
VAGEISRDPFRKTPSSVLKGKDFGLLKLTSKCASYLPAKAPLDKLERSSYC